MAENLKIIFISIGIFCAKFQVMSVIKCKDGREKMNKRATTGMEIFIPQRCFSEKNLKFAGIFVDNVVYNLHKVVDFHI